MFSIAPQESFFECSGVAFTARGGELNSQGMKSIQSISRSVEIGLRVIGLWPGMRYVILYRIFWFFTIAVFQTFQYRYFIMNIRKDSLSELMDALSTTMSYSLFYLKLIIFWTKRRTFFYILSVMAADCKEVKSKLGANKTPATGMAYFSCRVSNLIIGMYTTTVLMYAIGTIASELDPYKVRDVETRELLMKMELPFESHASPLYEILIVTQFFHQLTAATLVGVLNAIIVPLIVHLTEQIDLICQDFNKISGKSQQNDLPGSTLSHLIGRHQKVIKFSNGIEDLFSYIVLIQFLSNTLVICALGFVIVSSLDEAEGSTMIVKSFFFCVVVTLEAFILCYAGEYVSEKGKMIGNAAYNCVWYELKPREVKLLLILIMRSQKDLTITIGKFTHLSLTGFTTIIKASASYASVLRAR